MTLVFLSFFLLLLVMAIHEFGHAYVMYKKGIPLKEAGLGLPIGKLPYLKKKFFGLTLMLHPLLLGAYVMPTRDGQRKISKLSVKDQAHIDGAGVLSNILFGLVLAAVTFFLFSAKLALFKISIISILIALLWYGQKIFCLYFIPILGVLMAGFLAFDFVNGSSDSLMGPIGAIKFASSHIHNLKGVLILTCALSVGIGIFNTLPLIPLDGGKIVELIVQRTFFKKAWKVYARVGVFFILSLVIYVTIKDIYHLFG